MEVMEADLEILFQLEETERKMYKACEQVFIIDRKLQDLQKRLQAATFEGRRASLYNLKIQLLTLEGVRKAYRTYAKLKSEEVAEMTEKLYKDEESSTEDEFYDTDE
jgi:hypothetical protein